MTEALPDLRSATPTDWKGAIWGRFARRYGIAFLAIALALAAKLALAPLLSGDASYLFFLPAILIASAIGGLAPGLLATALGLFFGFYFVLKARVPLAADYVDAVAFALVGLGISWRGAILTRFRIAAATSAEDAEARAAHLKSILDS